MSQKPRRWTEAQKQAIWDRLDAGEPAATIARLRAYVEDRLSGRIVLPGGVINPDKLRLHDKAIDFIRDFGRTGRPVAAICHGPWTLINADLVRDKRLTSWPSLRVDLENAGARWEDREVVESGNLITSRKPDDIPAFTNTLIRALEERQAEAA